MPFDVPLATTCLFLDVDGSLLDIAAKPDEVVVPQGLPQVLEAVTRRLSGALAIVSGRSIAQLDELLTPLRFRAAGVHGAEWRRMPGGTVESAPGAALPRPLWDAVGAVLARFPGTFAEDKRFSFAVHYRAVPAAKAALEAALRTLIASNTATPLRLLPGHSVFEIKGGSFDKGEAVRRFLAEAPFQGRRPIFVGDDVTDHPGFAAAVAAGGRAFGVGADIPGTQGTFGSPSAVREWLAAMAATETMTA